MYIRRNCAAWCLPKRNCCLNGEALLHADIQVKQ